MSVFDSGAVMGRIIEVTEEGASAEDVKALRDVLANSHINLLLGAGYSAEVLQTLGKREKWLEWCLSRRWEKEEQEISAEAILQLEYFKNVLLPMGTAHPTENMDSFVKQIKRIIGTRGTITIPRRANIFTTNYDPLLEITLEGARCVYNDGFEGRAHPVYTTRSFSRLQYSQSLSMEYASQVPTINLVKLHGSLTWQNEGSSPTIKYQDFEQAIKVFSEKCGNLFELSQLKTVEQLVQEDVEKSDTKMIRIVDSMQDDISSDMANFLHDYRRAFCLINPTKRKFEETVMGLTYYELLRLYANELDRNNALAISFGFSFADEHILEITKRALVNPQLILLVSCHSEEDLDSYQKLFRGFENVWYLVPKNCVLDLSHFCSILNEVQ